MAARASRNLTGSETFRGRGLGSALLERAESFAREFGATGVYLDTLEFQALEFYRHRYSIYRVLERFPPSSRRFYLQKRLDATVAEVARDQGSTGRWTPPHIATEGDHPGPSQAHDATSGGTIHAGRSWAHAAHQRA